jgi:hypothetical protein
MEVDVHQLEDGSNGSCEHTTMAGHSIRCRLLALNTNTDADNMDGLEETVEVLAVHSTSTNKGKL